MEFEALEYFAKVSSVRMQNAETIRRLLELLHPIKLTKAEKLQIVNLLPRTPVEFYLIVEECDERFTEEQVEEVLGEIDRLFPRREEETSVTES